MRREVERKFFFDPALWKPRPLQTSSLAQGYLADTGGWEIRLRRAGEDHRFTLKQGSGIDRGEWEVPITGEAFEELWARTSGTQLTKERQSFSLDGLVAEVDRYQGALDGLVTVEVEFPDREHAAKFVVPAAFGPELTYDPRFKNRSLAKAPAVPCRWQREGSSWSYGVIPFQRTRRGLDLVMVSTRDRRRWIYPKGQPEPGKSPEQVAVAEALEEAGLRGRICGHPVVLPYQREQGTTNLLLFPFEVSNVATRWQEASQRDRRIIRLDEATLWGEVVSTGAQVVLDSLRAVGPRKKNKGETDVKAR